MADAGECCYQEYPDVEPLFDGNPVKLPFLKDYVCPGTFVSLVGEGGENYNHPQLVRDRKSVV